MIEQVDHQRPVRAQADVGSLIHVASIDQNRISILPPPPPNLRHATCESAEVGVPRVIACRQSVSVQVRRVQDRNLNYIVATQRACRAGDLWRGAE